RWHERLDQHLGDELGPHHSEARDRCAERASDAEKIIAKLSFDAGGGAIASLGGRYPRPSPASLTGVHMRLSKCIHAIKPPPREGREPLCRFRSNLTRLFTWSCARSGDAAGAGQYCAFSRLAGRHMRHHTLTRLTN